MGRNKNNIVWDQFETNNGPIKCKHCAGEFNGKPSATRLKDHLLGVARRGIRSCGQVPDCVKNALANASSSSKRPRIEAPSSINNNEFNNQGGNEQQTLENLQFFKKCLEQSDSSAINIWGDTSALQDREAEMLGCMIGLDPRINEVNNSASTSAPQQNNDEFQNRMQADQEVVQGTDQEFQNRMQANQEFNEENEQMIDEMMTYENNGEPFQAEILVGKAFQGNMNAVLKWLMCGEVSSIGIYGMGGVGKTTLLKHIYNRILKNKSRFGEVYWVTVSQDFSIERLQNLVAKTIHLDFANENDINRRAAKLLQALSRKCKFFLILDDLWDHFGVKEVGIPVGMKESKLIVASRSRNVCSWINCQKEIKLLPLSNEEAWKLFLQTLGHPFSSSEVEQIARSVVGECSGLPLGIVTMAASMRRVDDIHEWNNALTELKNSEVREDDMEPEVFRILRYSYARLNDPRLQQCLLYCALYPEDSIIGRYELIEHLVVERIIERKNRRRKATYDKGQTMLNKLVNVCLLEQTDYGNVKMHDLIRDMAIQIMGECSPSLVEASKQLTSLPDDKWWKEDTVRVSLMRNDIKKIPTNCSPKCPKLSTLFLHDNERLESISEPFFFQLYGLKVLNLSGTKIHKLPESVALLENLIALYLSNCVYLRYVPSLRKLGALEVLDLYHCPEVKKVPEGLEWLSNLNYLNLLYSGVMKLPSGILGNLSQLQFLAFNHLSKAEGVNIEELGCLSNLEVLKVWFNDQGDWNNYMHVESQQLSKYFLLVHPLYRDENFGMMLGGHHMCDKSLFFMHWTMSREVLLPEDIQCLVIKFVSIKDGRSLCLKNAIDLKCFDISRCHEIEYLFCLSSSPSIFLSLESVNVFDMGKLSGLFSGEGDDGVIPIQWPPSGTFSCLKKFKLSLCKSMNKLFPSGLLSNFQNLQELEVGNCSAMEEIIASEEREEQEEEGRSNTHFTLPNLRLLRLAWLPKLKSICSAKLICDSLQHINIELCSKLKKIPIYLTQPFVKHIIGNDGNHWSGESFMWERGEK